MDREFGTSVDSLLTAASTNRKFVGSSSLTTSRPQMLDWFTLDF